MFFRRFTCVKQNDQSDCGPACLATVALHHNLPVRLEQMRTIAGTDRVGTNLMGMVQAAERLGFRAKAVKGPFELLPKLAVAVHRTRANQGGTRPFRRPTQDQQELGRDCRPGAAW